MTTTMEENLHIDVVHIPEDIIVNNILCRLPVKSLNRFRCVSKRWCSRISDPQFAKLHFKLASEQKALTQRHLVSTYHELVSLDVEAPSFGDGESSSSWVRHLTFPTRSRLPSETHLLGSCNGLVVVSLNDYGGDKELYLWNPSTKFTRKIPNPRSEMPSVQICGFGYVSAIDDYKLLLYSRFFSESDEEDYMGIFSLRENSWVSVESRVPVSDEFRGDMLGVLTNESLHWVYRKHIQGNFAVATMFAFDLAGKEYRRVPLPNFFREDEVDNNNDGNGNGNGNGGGVNFHPIGVRVLSGGCLCVWFSRGPYGAECMEFWVMREYGVRESWTMRFKFNMGGQSLGDISIYETILVTDNGTAVFKSVAGSYIELIKIEGLKEDQQLVCGRYSPKHVLRWLMCLVIPYHETLLSVPQ